ncbi:hypothetical protein ZHAS_00021394 [Anopheles sinensis]|uniref:Uncharacterized protein n=1 Tax=Anopheles sinensis TaxID=74873 RepID=A0A084WSA7_ANOSI|nr:hypothetical protein ZHAS_00021394 [Anopheles sinensis]
MRTVRERVRWSSLFARKFNGKTWAEWRVRVLHAAGRGRQQTAAAAAEAGFAYVADVIQILRYAQLVADDLKTKSPPKAASEKGRAELETGDISSW